MIFTQHLYNRDDVLKVLLFSLLKKDVERTMYWAFELYTSGFGKEVFYLVWDIYKFYYKKHNPLFKEYFKMKYTQWKNPKEYITLIERERIFTTILLNLLFRSYKEDVKEEFQNFAIDEHKKYYTSFNFEKAYWVLQENCLYGINDFGWLDEYNSYFKKEREEREEYLDKLHYHWEYYAYFSPIWKKRIEKYKGYQNHSTKRIEFLNNMYEEDFYDKYMYEPDEQHSLIQERIHGYLP